MTAIQTLVNATQRFAQSTTKACTPAPAATPQMSAGATFQSSEGCTVADQQRALKMLGVGRASEGWTKPSDSVANVTFGGPTSAPKGKPKDWSQIKQNLNRYVHGAQRRDLKTTFADKGKAFLHLDRSGNPDDPTTVIKTYLPPGCITVSMHGERPVNRETGDIYPNRNARPFWNGTESMFPWGDDGSRSVKDVVAEIKPHLKEGDDTPIFLNSCNAGTESQGYTPAAEFARESGRYVIAPVDSRILATINGPQLSDKGGQWRVFHPDGTSELLYCPTTFPALK